jgi:hypothetical protein
VIRYHTGEDLLDMPHIPIMEYVLRRSGSVIVGGTSPVKTSLRAFLLKIALPFSDLVAVF